MIAKRLSTAVLLPVAKLANRLSILQRVWAHARLSASLQTKVDPSVVVLGLPEVHGTARVHMGKELFLYSGLHLETQGSGSIDIGNRVVISRGVHLVSHSKIVIGDHSMIGEYASIRDANHRFGSGRLVRHSGYKSAPIEIGRNVWIGRGACILKGVTIGDNCVVGANAVVTHDIPSDSVVAGVPAHAIHKKVEV